MIVDGQLPVYVMLVFGIIAGLMLVILGLGWILSRILDNFFGED